MIFSKREYTLANKPVSEQIVTQVQAFLTDGEKVLYTFDNNEVIAFFTDKKAVFATDRNGHTYETEILPYHSINRCIVLGTPDAVHGKLELVVSDEVVVSFSLPQYDDAVKLCHIILQ